MSDKVIAAGLILPTLTRTVAEEHLEELTKLIETAGGSVVKTVLAKRQKPDPASFFGSGLFMLYGLRLAVAKLVRHWITTSANAP